MVRLTNNLNSRDFRITMKAKDTTDVKPVPRPLTDLRLLCSRRVSSFYICLFVCLFVCFQLQRKRTPPVQAGQAQAPPARQWSRWLGGVCAHGRRLVAPQTAGPGPAVLPALPAGRAVRRCRLPLGAAVCCQSFGHVYCSSYFRICTERKGSVTNRITCIALLSSGYCDSVNVSSMPPRVLACEWCKIHQTALFCVFLVAGVVNACECLSSSWADILKFNENFQIVTQRHLLG